MQAQQLNPGKCELSHLAYSVIMACPVLRRRLSTSPLFVIHPEVEDIILHQVLYHQMFAFVIHRQN